jgi:glycosyltransferase involved in cell wall biosynthesis
MINILFIHQSAELYGSDKTLLLLLRHIDKTRFYPVVVLPNDGPLKEELEKENIKVIIAPVLKVYRKMFTPQNLLKFIKDIKKGVDALDILNKQYHFDIVYSNTLAVLLGIIYAKKRKIKHLWHVHEIIVHPKIIASIFPKILMRYSNLVICNSNATQKNLTNRVPELKSKTTVIYNGMELNSENKAVGQRYDFGFNESDIIITLVGRISRLKGHKLLLDVFTNHISKNENVKLLFVGSPVEGQEYYLDEIQNSINRNKLQTKVTILPFLNNLNGIWSITDIAIMPSTEAESFGLVAVEAMLAKKPVVASDLGGLSEIVINNETGFLFDPNSKEALSEALFKLIESPLLRSEFGEKGHERAIREFSIEKHVKNFEAVFENFQDNF